ncbi:MULTISPECIES: FAD-dependent oxidoreductase [Polaromonas]|uniref:FAD-dependent oxidoreductase n=1 Tax=Polaromonas aquatica TaxID=332657 RepID=A0ABW1U5Q9_9BURK
MFEKKSLVADVAVIGGGLAGMVSALCCAMHGRRVVVLEKLTDQRYVCNSRIASGVFHVAMTTPQTSPQALQARMASRNPGGRPELVKALSDDALQAIHWLRDNTDARFIRAGAEALYDYVLAPPSVARTGRQWQGRGADVLLRNLEARLVSGGGQLMRGIRAERLLMEGSACAGVEGLMSDALPFEVRSSCVVIADGGFQGSDELLARYVCAHPSRLVHRNTRTGAGDGLRMALAAGAGMTMDPGFYGHVQSRSGLTDDSLWPYPWLDELVRCSILVTADGHRFADEGRGGIYLANQIARLPDPASSIVIADAAAWEGPAADRPTGPNPKLLLAGGTIFKANNLGELAIMASINPQGLLSEVARYNEAVASETCGMLDPARTVSDFKPWPISRSPFYAIPAAAGITYTLGGISVDAASRVLKTSGDVLPGLYAAGSAAGGLEGGEGAAYFGGLVKAAVTGLRAAKDICSRKFPDRSPH